ncbi:hypothetical protein C1H46_012312 [Malus baccata]|uniref:Uncharacterized protein n=1 Tax=Malus baccata TaxID=106549 RepID=A0A540MTG4_MALBA|nr:hypothetical protein C1H46_012312 [Malus baccata]
MLHGIQAIKRSSYFGSHYHTPRLEPSIGVDVRCFGLCDWCCFGAAKEQTTSCYLLCL